ncbi:MAG: efflux RND transporter periplasmic adaptor subunit [Pseudohongiellaceae bacterium]
MKYETVIHRLSAGLLALLLITGCSDDQGADAQHEDHAEGAHQETVAADAEEHAAHEEDEEVHLTVNQRSMLDIVVDEAQAGQADARIQAAATVRFDPDRTSQIAPRVPANVVEVLVDLGDRVEAGQPLVRMDSTELGRARTDHLVAAAELSASRQRLEREESLAEQQISSQAELIEARSAFEQARARHRASTETLRLYGLSMEEIENHGPPGDEPLSRYTLQAPADGTVQRRDLVRGQRVAPDDAPLLVVDTREVWLMIEAFEQSLSRLQEGDPVRFRTRALPEQTFPGEIDWISASLDEATRTLHVRARLDNPGGLLRAGMTGTATIDSSGGQTRVTLVPIDAVQRIGERDVVFVPGHEPGAYLARTVITGMEANGLVGINEGLVPGEQVVVQGAFDLMSTLTAGSRSAAHNH